MKGLMWLLFWGLIYMYERACVAPVLGSHIYV